ncbi:hypothetical protein RFI_08748 [Reticulomyxa filosa]|uniref:Calcium-dependent protein kinase n=1 Tax=Reticulomyxa filosa TaxID=46433 RepID=X6NR75_RETFI|nr:hypothetical protein RFI_08748 [Reticulomyxa filosa]|eukprot:ETO28393.1 hypothetical protein RFI_08748 [Reticulomyxa filosa]
MCVLQLYDVYEDRNYLYLVTNYCGGGTLDDHMSKKRDLREIDVAQIMKQVLEGVQFLHGNYIAHLDLKPSNIMFANKNKDSPVQLVDFGVSHGVPRLTKRKGLVGTVHFIAPEVINGQYDAAADIWSCGIILYFMLKEGLGPWFPANHVVSQDVKDLIARMLNKHVKDRITVREALDHDWFKSASDKTLDHTIHDALTKFSNQCKFRVLISQILAHKLPNSEFKKLETWFKNADENNDNKLSLLEFKKVMHSYKLGYTEVELERMFEAVDLDHSNEIDFQELLTAFAFQRMIATDERLYETFRELDKDNDGFITKKELQEKILELENDEAKNEKALKLLGLDDSNTSKSRKTPHLQVTRLDTAVDWADIDLDGKINYEEFLAALHPDFSEPNVRRPDTPSKSATESDYLHINWISHSNVTEISQKRLHDSETETEVETEVESDEEIAVDEEERKSDGEIETASENEDLVPGMFSLF